MKILYISSLYYPHAKGGAERTLRYHVEGMAARGHDVSVLTTGPDAGLSEEYINKVHVFRTGVRNLYWHGTHENHNRWQRFLWHALDAYNPLMKRVVKDVIRAVKPDVVSCHNLPGISVSAWDAVHEAGIPLVQVLHDQYLLCPRTTMTAKDRLCDRRCLQCRTLRSFFPKLSKKVTAVVGVSKFIVAHLLRNGYFSSDAIFKVVHNAFIHGDRAIEAPRRTPDGKIRFGFIGKLDKSKGIELLLEAFTESASPGWELHIAGPGNAAYIKTLRDSYAREGIVFHGVMEQDDFYRSIDVLVVPSIWNDTLPGVVFEGLAYGLPVIGSNRGGIPEMITDGWNGILFNPDRPEELRKAMYKMCDDCFRGHAASAARQSAAYFLDVDRFISGYEDLFMELCKGKSA